MSTSTSGWRGLKQAQRAFKLTSCQECGTKDNLHRHHKDRDRLNNTPENIAILCHPCHAKEHAKQGDWGRGNVPHRPCQICGQVFQSNRTRRGRVCSNACMVEMGKRSAAKRWAGRTKERQCTNCQKTFTYTRPRQTTLQPVVREHSGPPEPWWSAEPVGVPRVATGIAKRADRLKAIGNGQVPQVAALAWNTLHERIQSRLNP